MNDVLKQLQQLKDEQEARRKGIFYSMKSGDNWLYVVFGKGQRPVVSRMKHGVKICRHHTNGEKCYGCEAERQAKKRGDKKWLDSFKAKERGFLWAVPKNVLREKKKKGEELTLEDVKLVDVSAGVLKKIINTILSKGRNPFEPDDVQCLNIQRTDRDDAFKYDYAVVFGEEHDASDMLTEEFLDSIPSLDEHEALQAASNEEIRKWIEGDTDSKPQGRRSRNVDTSEFDEEDAGMTGSSLKGDDDEGDVPF